MKKRAHGFIGVNEIDHDGEPFDYIKELHAYLWRVVRIVSPRASGHISEFVDEATEALEAQSAGDLSTVPEIKALIEAARALLSTARADYAGKAYNVWPVYAWLSDEPTVAALDAALAPFGDVEPPAEVAERTE